MRDTIVGVVMEDTSLTAAFQEVVHIREIQKLTDGFAVTVALIAAESVFRLLFILTI